MGINRINTFIFDLDGTLLPMPSQQKFLETYLNAVAVKVTANGNEPKSLIKALMSGTEQMIRNDGSEKNDEIFWKEFCRILGKEARKLEDIFDDFYRNEFVLAKSTTSTHPLANNCIQLLKEKGYGIALATNPLFPRIATQTRMRWAGLDPEDFDLITTYENSSYCKPNLEYFKEVPAQIDKNPEECIMVGNDVTEDMCASRLGMDTYLLNDCLICPEGEDITSFKQGDFDDLYEMIKGLPDIR